MKIESIISIVNKACNDERYTRARQIMSKEWNRLIETRSYQLLNDNAKQLIKIIVEEKEKGTFEALSHSDKKLLKLMNDSVREVNLPFAKRIYIEYIDLFERQEAQGWLSSDARFVCDAWKKAMEVNT
ncbi:hypothetical protein JOC77_000242 [Peribacillus deserti]|uniref:RsbT co-antagonist protein RsbRD N-terminal domain-containing protein n=1 Tax=Peribacillus deserti TaxID=673318 RepID=A0ABS2QDE8_9BACI|nr:hypothetical protein [Peribacillus deserti]MBM7690839.1 hypothetical protein [Peribacillus deserti]